MSLSSHYYVLSLAAGTTLLFEAFRDFLIELENRGFPIHGPPTGSPTESQLRELARTIDSSFGQHHAGDPLKVVVVGDSNMLAAFRSVTSHGQAIAGQIEGDHSATSGRDLGQIVWPVVREAMSGVVDSALRDLEVQAARGRTACGLEAVVRQVRTGATSTLLVEEDFHVRGGLRADGESPVVSPDVDVRDSIDDAIDAVIAEALEAGGNVVFTPRGSLSGWQRIASFLRSRAEQSPGGQS